MRKLLAGMLTVLALAAAACGSGSGSGNSAQFTGIEHAPYTLLKASLTDTDGKPYTLAADADKPLTLVFFGYTHCPDLCPLVMQSLSAAMQLLDDADRMDVDVVFVTTDPGRDTTDVLRKYLDRYDPSFVGLTGKLDTIVRLGESMKIFVGSGQKLPSGGYDLTTHDTHVSAVRPNGKATVLWSMDTSPRQFAGDIHTLLQKVRA
ncbi:SCO family protein [Nocardioides sp. KR10-350]|uniref:SCO family protein n=1 Tax=Nocardioides cheoyonin TaxID=3156615 RepID=UPI0032B45218